MKSTYSIRAFSIPRSTIISFRNQTLAILLVCIGNDLPVLFAEGNHFQGEIAPIITRRCLECHDEGTKEGGLDLTSRSSAMAGGESGPALKAANIYSGRSTMRSKWLGPSAVISARRSEVAALRCLL